MLAGRFQRYVWVNGERKRKRNREKYEESKEKCLENECVKDEESKETIVIWPGEFEEQLEKNERKRVRRENRGTPETPAIQTPSSLHEDIIFEDLEEHVGEDRRSLIDEKIFPEEPRNLPETSQNTKSNSSDLQVEKNNLEADPYDVDVNYSDEFLPPPTNTTSAHSNCTFFLVSTNLIKQ